MNNILIVFASQTSAEKIKSMLEHKFNIRSKLIQTPIAIPVNGCSYSIRLKSEDFEKARSDILNANVRIRGIYKDIDYSKIY